MTGRNYRLGRLDLVQHAERIDHDVQRARNAHTPDSGHDTRTGDQYWADLVNEAERSLLKSRNWRAGRALADHLTQCDCPPTLAGCVERRAWHTIADIPKGGRPKGGRPKGGQP